jgi:hypothetical protein
MLYVLYKATTQGLKKPFFFIALYCKHCKEGAILVTQFLTPLKYLKKYRKKNISIKEKWDKEEKK